MSVLNTIAVAVGLAETDQQTKPDREAFTVAGEDAVYYSAGTVDGMAVWEVDANTDADVPGHILVDDGDIEHDPTLYFDSDAAEDVFEDS